MRRAALVLMCCLLSACAARHHDVLVFGTDTSFGVNVGADPASAQVTNVSIGYKRREAVWMPLIVNATESLVYCAEYEAATENCKRRIPGVVCLETDPQGECKQWGQPLSWSPKYVGEATGVSDKIGGSTRESDTYSVFASFGGSAGGGTGSAKAAVAQFFATGIAAQRLGASDSASKLISTSPVDPAGEQAKGKVDALESTVESQKVALATVTAGNTDQSAIVDCLFGSTVTDAQRTAKLSAIEKIQGIRDTDVAAIKSATTPSALRAILSRSSMFNSLDDVSAACRNN